MADPLFDPIDLDAITGDPEEMHRAALALRQMAAYAFLKARFLKARHAERPRHAREIGAALDRFYDDLPEWAQWCPRQGRGD